MSAPYLTDSCSDASPTTSDRAAPTRVLITGANGFIGSNLCAYLKHQRGVDVVGLVRPGSDLTYLSKSPGLTLVEGDLGDTESLSAAMSGTSVVYHLAGLASDWGTWRDFRAANVEGVRNVLAAARNNGVRRIVHVSSVSAYGFPGGVDLDETTPFVERARDRYISTKAAGDRLVMQANGPGLETAIVRPAGVYGPNDHVTTYPLAQTLERGWFAYVNGGRHFMAPAYVDNLVDLIRLAGEHDCAPGQAFNAVDDGLISWRQFIEWLCEDLGCRMPRMSFPAEIAWPIAVAVENIAKALRTRSGPPITSYRVRATMQDNHYSAGKAKRLLGWRPCVTTREGVRRAARWYLDAKQGGSCRG